MTGPRSVLAGLGLVGLVSVHGCLDASPSDDPVLLRSDSAGVPVHALAGVPAWNDPRFLWSVELERAVATARSDPAEEPLLYNPQQFTRLDDGKLVVLDGGEQRLAVVAAARDSVLSRFGRSGQGPGEVLSSNGLLRPGQGDSFWLLDPGNQRLTRFSVAGALLEERPIEVAGMGGLAVLRPTTHQAFFSRVFFSDTGLLTDSVLRFDEETGRVVPFAPMPPRHASRARNTASFPYFAPAGTFAPVGSGGVVVARTDEAEFRRYSEDGILLGVLRVRLAPRPISLSEKPAIIEEMAREYPPAASATHDDLSDQFPIWSQMWAFGDSLFALEHTRWATPDREPEIPSGQRVWRLFSVDGAYAGVIRFPIDFGYPYWIESGRVIGIRRDRLGVATIESYRVRPPGGTGTS